MSFTRKKILIINNGLSGGGIERASVSLANYFASAGHNVHVLALYRSNPFFVLDERIGFTEPEFERLSVNRYLYLVKMVRYARKQIIRIKPDTILAFGEWTNPYVVIASTGLKIPVYVSDRMNPLAKLPWISELLRKVFYKRTAGIIAQTKFAKEVLQKKTKARNVFVIPNPVNIIEKVHCEPKKRIVTVGRLSPEKGHHILIQAFATIKDKSWELSIVGEGVERLHLEKLASDLQIQNRVLFHGHLKDFALQLSEAQVFVLPSLKEGFPNALIEAMSLPLACISTNFFADVNEIIHDGENGLLVPPGDVKAMTEAINKLIDSPELRKKLAGNAFKIREKLNFNKIADQYLNTILYGSANPA